MAIVKLSDLPPGAREQVLSQLETQKRHSNAQKCEQDGERFDSKAELARWQVLKSLAATGEIKHLRHEAIMFRLGRDDRNRPVKWLPDFTYIANGSLMVDEVKGRRFRDFGKIIALFRMKYPEWSIFVNGVKV